MKIIIAIAIVLAIIWVFQVLESRFPIMPPFIFDILTVLVVSIGIIYCYLVYSDIGRHDLLNYDQLNIPPPSNAIADTSGNKAPNSGAAINGVLNTGTGCIGQACCGSNTVWDSEYSMCKQLQAFTTIEQIKIQANEPFEYSDYAPLK